jgi:hypothetical protein
MLFYLFDEGKYLLGKAHQAIANVSPKDEYGRTNTYNFGDEGKRLFLNLGNGLNKGYHNTDYKGSE